MDYNWQLQGVRFYSLLYGDIAVIYLFSFNLGYLRKKIPAVLMQGKTDRNVSVFISLLGKV